MFHALDKEFSTFLAKNLKLKTPFFLFSIKKIKARFKEFKKFFPKSQIHYAVKANSEPELLKVLKFDENTKEIEMEFISGKKLSEHLDSLKNWKESSLNPGLTG